MAEPAMQSPSSASRDQPDKRVTVSSLVFDSPSDHNLIQVVPIIRDGNFYPLRQRIHSQYLRILSCPPRFLRPISLVAQKSPARVQITNCPDVDCTAILTQVIIHPPQLSPNY